MHPWVKVIQFCLNEESFNSHIKSRNWVSSSLNQQSYNHMYLYNWTVFAGEHYVPLAFCLFYDGAIDMQIWAFLTKSQCTVWILCLPLRHMGLLFKKKCKNKTFTKLWIYFQTTNVLETPTSRRNQGDSSASIEIKQWGQQIDVLNFQVDQTVLFTCLTVDVYGTKTSLNTNMSTTIEVQQNIYYCFILSLSDLLN